MNWKFTTPHCTTLHRTTPHNITQPGAISTPWYIPMEAFPRTDTSFLRQPTDPAHLRRVIPLPCQSKRALKIHPHLFPEAQSPAVAVDATKWQTDDPEAIGTRARRNGPLLRGTKRRRRPASVQSVSVRIHFLAFVSPFASEVLASSNLVDRARTPSGETRCSLRSRLPSQRRKHPPHRRRRPTKCIGFKAFASSTSPFASVAKRQLYPACATSAFSVSAARGVQNLLRSRRGALHYLCSGRARRPGTCWQARAATSSTCAIKMWIARRIRV